MKSTRKIIKRFKKFLKDEGIFYMYRENFLDHQKIYKKKTVISCPYYFITDAFDWISCVFMPDYDFWLRIMEKWNTILCIEMNAEFKIKNCMKELGVKIEKLNLKEKIKNGY